MNLTKRVIKYYPYRTGIVRGLDISRDLVKPLEESLFKEIGQEADNHTCFAVMGEHGTMGAVMFTDTVCVFGNRVEERRW